MSKQSSIELMYESFKNRFPHLYAELRSSIDEIYLEAKTKHKEEIEEAYDRKVIGDIQNWHIRNGKHYYELHYNKNTQDGEIG